MKYHQAIRFLMLAGTLLLALAACNKGPKPLKHNAFSILETIEPPTVIKAGNPVIHQLSDYPPPQFVDITAKPVPVKIPADFFVSMQNFNTEHGLAPSTLTPSSKGGRPACAKSRIGFRNLLQGRL